MLSGPSMLVLPVAVAILAFAFLPAPFAWTAGALGLLALALALRARRRRAKRAWAAAVGLAALWTVLEIALPGPPPPRAPCDHSGPPRSAYEIVHPVLGTAPTPATVIPAAGMRGNKDFDGVYTIDDNGLRVSHPSTARRSILFFGCSYTYGLNVGDEETFAYLASRELAEDFRGYNFGYVAYGAQQMLRALDSGLVSGIVREPPRAVFFLLINSHVRRAVRDGWSPHAPRYLLGPDGEAVSAGRLCEAPLEEPGVLEALLERSAIHREALSHTWPSHVDTLVAILRAARDEVERRFPDCRFEVLYWNRKSWKEWRLERELRASGIPLTSVTDILPGFAEDYYRYFLGPDDFHPDREAHRRIARFMVDRVRALDRASGAPGGGQ